jgi:3-polyprenyl-4-hydroxybenzoate decarboxylase
MSGVVSSVALQLETQSLNMIVMGFTFAAAISWFHAVRSMVEKFVKTNGSAQSDVVAALATTFLAIVVFMVIKAVARNVTVKNPSDVIYAVTA